MKPFFVYLLCLSFLSTMGQEFYPLWPAGKKPNSNGKAIKDSLYNERIWQVAQPGIYSFRATKAENIGTAILICPGGGYERVSYIYNGFNLARWYNTMGINAFVLIYRLPHQQDLKIREQAPLQDAQRAIKFIRSNATLWNINTQRIGVMGVSAGGHVATTLGTHCKDESAVYDALDTINYMPNFMVLVSPVITMGKYDHGGSKKNFLGSDTADAFIKRYSNELNVSACTPPAFIVHAYNDPAVDVRNSLMFYSALVENNIKSSLHIFPQGGHGIRLDENPGSTDLWTELLERWLKEMNYVTPIPFK